MHAAARIPESECTSDEFIWAMCMVQSRTFGGGHTMVMLPYIDLVNTESEADLDFDLRQVCCFRLPKPIPTPLPHAQPHTHTPSPTPTPNPIRTRARWLK